MATFSSSTYAKESGTSHAGVAVAGWAGDYDCSVCRRKRLTASEFSKKMQEKHRADPKAALKCKQCVDKAAQAERDASAAKAAKAAPASTGASASAGDGDGAGAGAASHVCSACEKALPASAFNKTQLSKGEGKQRCRECVTSAEQAEASGAAARQAEALRDAKTAAKRADAVGSTAEKLKANAALAAAEAELVTGLKPIVLGRGRSRGRGAGRGRGVRAPPRS